MGVPHSRCSVRKATSDFWVARASPIGMLTRPKLIDPFQIVRIGACPNCRGTRAFALPQGFPSLYDADRDDRVPVGASDRIPHRDAHGPRPMAVCPGAGV